MNHDSAILRIQGASSAWLWALQRCRNLCGSASVHGTRRTTTMYRYAPALCLFLVACSSVQSFDVSGSGPRMFEVLAGESFIVFCGEPNASDTFRAPAWRSPSYSVDGASVNYNDQTIIERDGTLDEDQNTFGFLASGEGSIHISWIASQSGSTYPDDSCGIGIEVLP